MFSCARATRALRMLRKEQASLEGNGQVPSSAPPNLVQELTLCDHPHAIAKIPTEQTYSAPLINRAAIMMFLHELNCVYRASLVHRPYRFNSFQPLRRNPLEYLDCLRSPLRAT